MRAKSLKNGGFLPFEEKKWLKAALNAVNGRMAVRRALEHVCFPSPPAVIALGKAAESMILGALDAVDQISALFGVSKAGHWQNRSDILSRVPDARLLEGGHPLPDERSLEAGGQLADWIDTLVPGQPVLVLISGGASALVEWLRDGISLDDWRALNHWLLGSGWPIERINRVRAQYSRIKGGGLVRLLAGRAVTGLLISDVAGDDPALVGSGPLLAVPPPDPEDWRVLPEPFCHLPLHPPMDVSACDVRVIASSRHARQAAVAASGGRLRDGGELYGLVDQLRDRILSATPGVIFGGEATVELPSDAPPGGRNQHLALIMARAIAGTPRRFVALGTDGTDGTTDVAGAWVDGKTWGRAEAAGLAPEAALARFDAHRVLTALGQTIRTGPTGTNVMDLMLWL